MLQRTGVGSAFNNWRRSNPRLAHSLPDLALDASSREIDRACSPSSGRQLDRLSPVSPNERGRDPRSSGEEENENMLQRMGLSAFIGSVGTNDGLSHNLELWGSSLDRVGGLVDLLAFFDV